MPKTKTPKKPKSPPPTPPPRIEASYGWELPLVSWHGQVAGVHVNEFTILKVATVFACIRYIATTIATTHYNVYENLPKGGKEYQPDHPVDWILDKEANPETPAVVFWETMIAHAMIWGNAYAEIQRDGYTRPQALWQIEPDRVCLKRDDRTREQYYEITNYTNEPSSIEPRNMYHLRGLSWDAQVGYDVARLCREVFAGPLAAQEFANAFFGNDATPGFALTTPNALSITAINRLTAQHNQEHQGPRNAHKIKVFEEGIMPVKLGANADETQLVDVQNQQVEQVARIFGVPLTKIGHLIHSGNRANLEEEDKAAYKHCLYPWSVKIECEADVKLFGRVSKGRLFTLHDFSKMLQGNSEQLTNQVCQLLDRGVLNVDEARDMFDLNPIGGALGKTRPFPRNFTILEKAGEDPKPAGGAPGNAPGAGRDNKPPGSAQTDVVLAQEPFVVLLADAYTRLLRVESDKAKRAGNKDQLGTHILTLYSSEGMQPAVDIIRPVIAAALTALGRSTEQAELLALQFADDHANRSIHDLNAGTWLKEWSNGRADHQAREHLNRLWSALQ